MRAIMVIYEEMVSLGYLRINAVLSKEIIKMVEKECWPQDKT